MGTLSLSFSRCRLGRAEHFLKTLWFSLRVMGSVVGGVCWRWGIISQQGHSFQQVAPHPPPPRIQLQPLNHHPIPSTLSQP